MLQYAHFTWFGNKIKDKKEAKKSRKNFTWNMLKSNRNDMKGFCVGLDESNEKVQLVKNKMFYLPFTGDFYKLLVWLKIKKK